MVSNTRRRGHLIVFKSKVPGFRSHPDDYLDMLSRVSVPCPASSILVCVFTMPPINTEPLKIHWHLNKIVVVIVPIRESAVDQVTVIIRVKKYQTPHQNQIMMES